MVNGAKIGNRAPLARPVRESLTACNPSSAD